MRAPCGAMRRAWATPSTASAFTDRTDAHCRAARAWAQRKRGMGRQSIHPEACAPNRRSRVCRPLRRWRMVHIVCCMGHGVRACRKLYTLRCMLAAASCHAVWGTLRRRCDNRPFRACRPLASRRSSPSAARSCAKHHRGRATRAAGAEPERNRLTNKQTNRKSTSGGCAWRRR